MNSFKLCTLLILFFIRTGSTNSIERLALIIGQNKGLADDIPLAFAEKDAKKVSQVLSKGNFFEKENIVMLQNSNANEVRQAFSELKGRLYELRRQNKNTLLMAYYSGHGSKEGLHIQGEILSKYELKSLFDNLGADMQVLILDACESGDFLRAKGGVMKSRIEVKKTDELESKGSIILSSSAAGELAQESVEYQGGVFSHHLINGLNGLADYNSDGEINVLEAFHYARFATQSENRKSQEKAQNPSYDFNTVGKAIPVLAKSNTKSSVLKFENLPVGALEIYNARSAKLYSRLYLSGQEELQIELPRGSYVASMQKENEYYSSSVELTWRQNQVLRESDFRVQKKSVLYARGGKYLNLNPHGFHLSFLGQNIGKGTELHYAMTYQLRQQNWNFQSLLGFHSGMDQSDIAKVENNHFRGQLELLKPLYQGYYGNVQLGVGGSAQLLRQELTDLRIGDKVIHEVKLDNKQSSTWVYGGHLPLLVEVFLPVGFWVQGGVQGSLYRLNVVSSKLEMSLEPRLSIGWGW